VPELRLFNGKAYSLFDWCSTKQEAVKEASELRNGHPKYLVRIIPAGTGFKIWRR